MKHINKNNKFILTATIFGIIGFILLSGVMIFHQHINSSFVLAQKEDEIVVLSVDNQKTQQLTPGSLAQEIIEDERNIIGSSERSKPLSPALKFLRTISDPDIFLTQK